MVEKQSNKFIVSSSKTILFLSNQIPQIVLLEISLQAYLWNLPCTISGHYRSSESSVLGKQHWIPYQSKTFIQTLLEKLQCIKRCYEVSKSELQKTHEACVADKTVRWWRKALVLTLSCIANQRNTWTFGGAPLIQTFASKTLSFAEEVLSIRVQQDLTEKLPSELHGHISLSSFPCRIIVGSSIESKWWYCCSS
jgi:hypothetical protein